MSSSALTKPVRVIRELTAAEQVMRKIERAQEKCKAMHARADAQCVQEVKDALAEDAASTPTNGTAQHAANPEPCPTVEEIEEIDRSGIPPSPAGGHA